MSQFYTPFKALLFLFALSLSACQLDSYEGIHGDLMGLAFLSDEYKAVNADNSGIQVTLSGNGKTWKTETDKNGVYKTLSLPSGSYNIHFSKDGYSQQLYQGYQFVGGDLTSTFPPRVLTKLPSGDITDFKVEAKQNSFAKWLSFDLSQSGFEHYQIYASHNKDVSYKNYDFYIKPTYNSRATLLFNDKRLKPGRTIYFIAYLRTIQDHFYLDLDNGKRIYTNLLSAKPSKLVTFSIPEIPTK